ncbi:O-antigen ligase [Bacteroides sp. 51]|uniref:O-antigen ligase family protein n=1 Tax=Bacteroides sp. 51 TaxID=2302938 RepID=UPI0013D5BD03|nr:O-antigen ligase family protein [Bacteroides sp. 51]NDV84915.1 O-antigen ligase domain-containing protein [Bacteroides sp. 51]
MQQVKGFSLSYSSKENIYAVLCCLSLLFHLYNELEVLDGVKLFHILSFLCLFFSFSLCGKLTKTGGFLYLFLFLSFLSSLFSPFSGSLSVFFTLTVLVIGFRGLVSIDGKRILRYMFFLTPLAVGSMYYLYFKEPMYRFQGYYNDPNYFTLTLNVYLITSLMSSLVFTKKKIRVFSLLNAVSILPLVMLTLSRTGLATTLLILLFYLIERYIQGKSIFFFIAPFIVLFFVFQDFFQETFSTQFDNLIARIDGNRDSGEGALDYRSQLNKEGLSVLKYNPEYAILGIGIGKSANAPSLFVEYTAPHRIHNTYVSVLVEQGFWVFILFLYMLWRVFQCVKLKNANLKYLRIGVLGAILLSSYSVWNMTYLPFWWLFFFICNPINRNEDTKYNTNM